MAPAYTALNSGHTFVNNDVSHKAGFSATVLDCWRYAYTREMPTYSYNRLAMFRALDFIHRLSARGGKHLNIVLRGINNATVRELSRYVDCRNVKFFTFSCGTYNDKLYYERDGHIAYSPVEAHEPREDPRLCLEPEVVNGYFSWPAPNKFSLKGGPAWEAAATVDDQAAIYEAAALLHERRVHMAEVVVRLHEDCLLNAPEDTGVGGAVRHGEHHRVQLRIGESTAGHTFCIADLTSGCSREVYKFRPQLLRGVGDLLRSEDFLTGFSRQAECCAYAICQHNRVSQLQAQYRDLRKSVDAPAYQPESALAQLW